MEERRGEATFREEERLSVSHPLPVKPMDLRGVARVLHPLVLASRERNYLIIMLNGRSAARIDISTTGK